MVCRLEGSGGGNEAAAESRTGDVNHDGRAVRNGAPGRCAGDTLELDVPGPAWRPPCTEVSVPHWDQCRCTLRGISPTARSHRHVVELGEAGPEGVFGDGSAHEVPSGATCREHDRARRHSAGSAFQASTGDEAHDPRQTGDVPRVDPPEGCRSRGQLLASNRKAAAVPNP